MAHANTERPDRNLAADFYRVSGVVLIVLGHWLAGSVTYHDGQFGRQNPLVDLPWTQWLTWPFQAVPTFFMVAGYAGAVSWTHRRDGDGVSRQNWLQHRLARVLGPTAVYAVLMAVLVIVLDARGFSASLLEYAGWAVAMHLWFLAVYLVVVSLTPIAIAAHRRWGLLVPAALGVGVAAMDVARLAGHVQYLDWVNYVLAWGALYQLGIAWHGGLFAGRRPVLLAGVSAVALALLIWLRVYPVSMIGVPGQTIDNTTPPTVALLAFGCAQTGIAMALAPALNRALRAANVRRMLAIGNNNIMALYLWHMIPVVIVAIIGYPAGLLPQPPEGTAQWWLARLEWVIVLGAVTLVEMVLLWWGRRIFAAPLPLLGIPVTERWAEPVMLAGAAMAAYGLSFTAAQGFAPDGHLAWPTVIVFAVGTFLVALRPTRVLTRR
ncbi:Peptidoglycan/LPS O-acetylase OafA/YrhL, contains acyltransferase and SGNH-hydrolase domains [Mycobacterium rhizamassiliense]|jgi:surface polysaccharide O-acyltransferase-like enzyme|uniref:Peptidoglycan/LPS O-acetylase OafA/YrhL, contains acyltransferase and SGNH-hydrolase domains n=1 Tax=Mycobacterium rhizamassiliense TaxID=1841860 RepID=A0A2U3NYE0_9MYCO|nr:acyltransferase [Mycobacterium rhizamassiliense]SPM36465.1 Peptidoglycan/LPS O-acetylase OafA/YrhL, contains acyltransferase and SGNH-hydrolase domains [Mycobacterium rhizamassiliense]